MPHVRTSSEIPYDSHLVTFIGIDWKTQDVFFAKGIEEKRAMLDSELGLYCSWGGPRWTDIFVVDRTKATKAL